MRTNSKQYKGTKIIAEYESSNIQKAEFDINDKTLQITFKSGIIYEYTGVTHEVFSAFDAADSQGKYFNQNIAKKFDYKRISQ